MEFTTALAAANPSAISPARHQPRDAVTITWFVILAISVVLLGIFAMVRFRMRTAVATRERETIPSSMGSHLDRVFPVMQPVTLTERRRKAELFHSDERPSIDETWIRPLSFQQHCISKIKPIALQRVSPPPTPWSYSIEQAQAQNLMSVGVLIEMPIAVRRETAAPVHRPLTLGVSMITLI